MCSGNRFRDDPRVYAIDERVSCHVESICWRQLVYVTAQDLRKSDGDVAPYADLQLLLKSATVLLQERGEI
jgi:hypothetical protein